MENVIKVLGVLLAILIIFSLILFSVLFSGVLPFHHFHIVFDDGEEYHINTLIDTDAENIYVYNFGAKYAIPLNDRSYEIHYCTCENSVANIKEIKEKENENLH